MRKDKIRSCVTGSAIILMRILMVTPNYEPDLGPASPLVTMLCEDLAKLGHQVSVLTAVPHFPTGIVAEKYRGYLWQRSKLDGVQVIRVWVPSGDRRKLIHRIFTFVSFQLLSTLRGMSQSYDAIILTNPAIETGLPFAVLAGLRHKKSIFCVWDVYPDVGVHLGIFRHQPIIATVKALEDFCLHRATYVQVLSPEFATTMVQRGVNQERIALIPPWIDTDFHRPLPKENEFAKEFNLLDRFVVMYAGNMGHSQGLEHLLQAAKLLSSNDLIQFVLIGDGASKTDLQQQVQQMGLRNVSFIPFQPRERLPNVLASADISFISLKKGIGQDSLPSKTFPILASGCPILAAVEEKCELWNLVQRAEAGICVEPENPQQLADAIKYLAGSQELCEQMGAHGREYAVKYHSRDSAAKEFEKLLIC